MVREGFCCRFGDVDLFVEGLMGHVVLSFVGTMEGWDS